MKKKKNLSEDLLSSEELSLLQAGVKASGDRSKLPPHDTSDRAHAIRFAKRNPVFIVSMSIISLALVSAIILGTIFGVRYLFGRNSYSDFLIYLGDDEYEVDYHDAVRDDVLYLDMRKLAKFAGMIVSGSDTKIKFTASEHQYLRFENESEFAVISGSKVEMSAKAIVSKNECLVPVSFLQKAISQGLRLQVDTDTNVIKIKRQLYSDTKKPADMLFSGDGFTVIQFFTPAVKEEISLDAYPIDIEPYLAYILPENESDFLILANKQTPLASDYAPGDLIGLTSDEIDVPAKNDSQSLRTNAAYALKAMLLAMATDDPSAVEELFVTSSYRDYSYQKMLYDGYVLDYIKQGMSRPEAEAEASKTSARPGESEHQTGLCFDFITTAMGGRLDERFAETAAFRWLSENAHLYGFILRYPANKVDITGYSYEPWHYRFVGRDAAVEIYNAGLSLEEYLELN